MKIKSYLASFLLMFSLAASAQEYANIWIKVKPVPENKGRVSASFRETANPPTTVKEYDAKGTVPITYNTIVMMYIYTRAAAGYTVGGVYIDDGDGVFDITKDQLFDGSTASPILYYFSVDDIDEKYVFDDDLEASFGPQPTEPQQTLFVYFTDGVAAEPKYDGLRDTGGTVKISSPNAKGETVSLTAVPDEGFAFDVWTDEAGNIVSRENPFTLVAQGGEHYYANFCDLSAPVIDFPAQGGWKVLAYEDYYYWLPSYSDLTDAYVVQMSADSITQNEAGQFYMKGLEEDGYGRWGVTCRIDYWRPESSRPTIMWGKGQVRFAKKSVDAIRGLNDILWSTTGSAQNPRPIVKDDSAGEGFYAYVFNEKAGAFILYGHTDRMADPSAPTSITFPRDVAYLWLPVRTFVNGSEVNIPKVIGLTPEAYELGMKIYNGEDIEEPLITVEDISRLIDQYLDGDPVTIEDITRLIDQYLSQE